jgi:hypothetical protein
MFFKRKGIPDYFGHPLTNGHRILDDLGPKGFGLDQSFHV